MIVDELVLIGEEIGIEKGVLREARAGLRLILDTRGLELGPAEQETIGREESLDTLHAWTQRAITAKSAAAVFTPARPRRLRASRRRSG